MSDERVEIKDLLVPARMSSHCWTHKCVCLSVVSVLPGKESVVNESSRQVLPLILMVASCDDDERKTGATIESESSVSASRAERTYVSDELTNGAWPSSCGVVGKSKKQSDNMRLLLSGNEREMEVFSCVLNSPSPTTTHLTGRDDITAP